MWHIIRSEMRQWLGVQIGTLLIGFCLAAVAFAIEADRTSTHGQPLDLRETRVFFVWLFLCAAPLLTGWYREVSSNPVSTFQLIDTLPLCRARLIIARIATLLAQLAPVLLVWLAHYFVLGHFDRTATPWTAVAIFFFVSFWAVAALNHPILWVGMWTVIVLSAVLSFHSPWEPPLSPAVVTSAAWTAAVFAVLTLAVTWWTIHLGIPRRAG